MTRSTVAVSRRLVMQGAVALAGLAATPTGSAAQSPADALLFAIADLHSPYARLPAVLKTIRDLRDEAAVPAAALINGDMFERGNVVATRSGGVADFAFLTALAAEMPVVVNLGNHETAILDDMAAFVAEATAAGAHVVSNLIDRRTGRFFAPVLRRIGLGTIDLSVLGLAATNPFVYRQPARDTLTFLDPAAFVADVFADAAADADAAVVMSHAGVVADRAFVDALPPGTILHGAHDHLTFATDRAGVSNFHGGSWGVELGVIELAATGDRVTSAYPARSGRARWR